MCIRDSKKTDQNISNMYANREPRFYASVVYQGRSWFKKWMNGNPNYIVDFSAGGGNDLSNGDNVKTGYMLGKFKNRTVNHASGDTQSWKRVSIIYRLAEFYLFYAEALNETDPSNPDIIKYIDMVRELSLIHIWIVPNANNESCNAAQKTLFLRQKSSATVLYFFKTVPS